MFQTYLNKGKNKGKSSGIQSFQIGTDYIDVKFFGSKYIYRYSYNKTGKIHVENMKKYALNGEGLNSYIMKNARKPGLFDKMLSELF